jgi:hypothetical protein
MNNKPAPTGLAIVVCDQIIEDKLTHKKSLIGIFNNISSPTFPCRHPQLSVFVSLTEGQGSYTARLRMANEETSESVTDINGQIQFPDIHAAVDLNFNLVGLTFPKPGLYSIEFYCDDALVLERRFHLTQVKPQQPPPKGPPPAEL